MHILVTGGAGYIGSTTTAAFLAAGHRVTVYDNLFRGHRAAVPAEANFVQGDLADPAALNTLFQMGNFDAVAHFAALIEAGESMTLPALYFRSNVSYTQNLLEAMLKHDVKKLVFSSTAAVFASKNAALQEDDAFGPANVYGETKLMIENMIRWYNRQAGLKYCIFRYFNACGASLDAAGKPIRGEAHQPETHLIPLTLQAALGQRDSIAIFGSDYPTADGTCVRDYIHVQDLAEAHVLAAGNLDNNPAMTYNLGNGRGYSVREVVETAREVTNIDIKAVLSPRRAGDAPSLVASSESVNNDLGWAPKYPDLKTIIGSAWAWHKAFPNGYKGKG
jgi:UDP-glucose 4-epimerase